ncbi:cysteine desulfurase family protein [Aedoeadaptatus coxii]|uniref:cysteine desulfurase family protein n=1 Tax=Aedoeadaptatus coxii TaxID=755172 RepID=UPI002AD3255B|nr:cysteine desulfurase family protein [Peptoniphilus coxii]
MIYLDHAATCPLRREALDAMLPYFSETYGNPSSQHGAGRAAKNALETARLEVATLFGVTMKEVFFTSSGTEADNMAILSSYNNRKISPGHMVTTAIEHEAVLETAKYLESLGVDVTYIKPDKNGVVSAEQVLDALRDDTFLVSIMAVNNEVGSLQPIEAIREGLKGKVPLHVDGVQAAGHLPVKDYSGDFIAISGHKFYGPKGVGILIAKGQLHPFTLGGGQERGMRSGTENVPSIIGMVEALKLAEKEREATSQHMAALSEACRKGLQAMEGVRLTVEGGDPRIVHAMVDGMERDVLLFQLDRENIAASGGSACQAGASTASHVLAAMGIDEKGKAPLRISFGPENTAEDVATFLRVLKDILERKRQ